MVGVQILWLIPFKTIVILLFSRELVYLDFRLVPTSTPQVSYS